MRAIAAMLALLMLTGAAQEADEDGEEIVTIRSEVLTGVCAGLCPSFKIDVSSGWVIGFADMANEPIRLRIDEAQHGRFRKRIAAALPVDGRQNARRCDAAKHGRMLEVIRYRRFQPVMRRVLCAGENRQLECAVALSLVDVGINPVSGMPLMPGQGPWMLEALRCETGK